MVEPPPHQGWERLWQRGVVYSDQPQPEVVDLATRLKAKGGRRVLDLGCGMGRHLLWLAAEGFQVSGCDVSPTAVAACRDALKASSLRAGIVCADMTALPFKTSVFHAVIAWDVVFHSTVRGILATIQGVHRSLSDNGLFLVTFNSIESSDRLRARRAVATSEGEELEPETYVVPGDPLDKALPHHYATEREIRTRLLAGFDILSMQKYGHEFAEHRNVKWWVLAERQ